MSRLPMWPRMQRAIYTSTQFVRRQRPTPSLPARRDLFRRLPRILLFNFEVPRTCGAFDTWPYGTRHRRGGSAGITDDQLKKQLFARPINYLVGSLDILPLANFDDSCAAMAQGPTRMARALEQVFEREVLCAA